MASTNCYKLSESPCLIAYKRFGPFTKLPSNFPRSECRGNPASDVFYVDELIAKGLGFALQIRQHPIAILLFIRLLSRVNVGHHTATCYRRAGPAYAPSP